MHQTVGVGSKLRPRQHCWRRPTLESIAAVDISVGVVVAVAETPSLLYRVMRMVVVECRA